MSKRNDFSEMARKFGKYAKERLGNPYEYAYLQVQEFVKKDKNKLLQLQSECEASDIEKTPYATVTILVASTVNINNRHIWKGRRKYE